MIEGEEGRGEGEGLDLEGGEGGGGGEGGVTTTGETWRMLSFIRGTVLRARWIGEIDRHRVRESTLMTRKVFVCAMFCCCCE